MASVLKNDHRRSEQDHQRQGADKGLLSFLTVTVNKFSGNYKIVGILLPSTHQQKHNRGTHSIPRRWFGVRCFFFWKKTLRQLHFVASGGSHRLL